MATKFVSSLTGPEMDSALTDMAYHNSEAYAVGTRNGVPVGSSDVTHHNNSKYWAEQAYGYTDRAEDAAARAEAAVPAGTAGAVFFDRAQSLTTAQQSQARANIMAGGSNPNLLDNWYFVGGGSQLGDGVFPINQRGQTQYAWSGATCIDMWHIFSASDTVTLSASGLTVNANDNGGVLGQRIKYYPEYSEQPLICTFLTTDNKRIVWSFTINTSTAWQGGTLVLNECPDFYVDALYDDSSNTVAFVLAKFFDNIPHSITLKAAKLELGTVSTLANDVPPDFGEELRKCQRYLWVGDFDTNTTITTGGCFSTNTVVADLVLPVSMRKTSTYTVSYTGSGALMGIGTVTGVTAYSVARVVDNHAKLFLTASGLTAHNIYSLIVTSASLKLTISAEL